MEAPQDQGPCPGRSLKGGHGDTHVDWDGSPGARPSILLTLIHGINTTVLRSIFQDEETEARGE